MKKSNLWLIDFYKGQINKVNDKIINLANDKNEFIILEDERINKNEYINFCHKSILKMKKIIKELENEF